MAFDFPATPSVGQVYTSAGCSFVWNGYGWAGGLSGDTGEFVKKAGDTMTGRLTAAATGGSQILLDPPSGNASMTLDAPTTGDMPFLLASKNGLSRWAMLMGDATAESGSGAGSNFDINRYDDSGAVVDTPLFIDRKTGAVVPKMAVAFAHRSGAGSVALGTATWTKINLGQISTGLNVGGGWNLNNNELNFPRAGIYLVGGSVSIQCPTVIGNILGGLYLNNTPAAPFVIWRSQNPVANNYVYSFPAVRPVAIAAGNTMGLSAYSGVAGAAVADTSAETNIWAVQIG